MIDVWPHWARPLWLLALPLLALLAWRLWHRQKRVGRWQLILPRAFHHALLSGGKGHDSKWPRLLLMLGWGLALLALLGPGWQRVEQSNQKPVDPLVVVLQLNEQMLATDAQPNRLEQARHKLLDVLEKRRDAQTAIIVYAGSAHVLVPLSDDLGTSRNLLEALKPSIMPQPGQRADLAIERALDLLAQAGQGQGRILLIGSALDDQERAGIARRLGRQSPPLLMLGVGSRAGAPVSLENGELLKDAQGAIELPRLDNAGLKAFLASVDGSYRQARLDDLDLRNLGLLAPPRQVLRSGQIVQLDSWTDQGHWLLLPLLLLAACGARRGWLFCLPLLLCLPQPSYAFEFADLWARPDQQGMQLLEQQRPAQAARRFEDPQWQGMALYEAGDYLAAAQRFAQGSTAEAHYNRGNALARAGELDAALDAYEQALEMRPQFAAALENKALVQQWLQQHRETPSTARDSPRTDNGSDTAAPGAAPDASNAASDPAAAQEKAQENAEQQRQSVHNTPPSGRDGGNTEVPGSQLPDEQRTRPPARPADSGLNAEQRLALEQWLRQIPDDPSELLRRKFWYEQQQRQDTPQ